MHAIKFIEGCSSLSALTTYSITTTTPRLKWARPPLPIQRHLSRGLCRPLPMEHFRSYARLSMLRALRLQLGLDCAWGSDVGMQARPLFSGALHQKSESVLENPLPLGEVAAKREPVRASINKMARPVRVQDLPQLRPSPVASLRPLPEGEVFF